MQTLFSNSGFNSTALMSQGLTEVLTNGFNLHDLPFGLLNTKPFKKPESPPILLPENRHSTPPIHTPVSSMGYKHFPLVEKSLQPTENVDAKNVKEKLLAALREIIPHKTSLNLRMLVTYTVDNASSDVIVIDETLSRKECEPLTTSGNILDLSQKSEDYPKLSNADNDLGEMLQKSAAPIMGLASNTSTPLNVIQPTTSSPQPTLNPEAALLMLQTLLTNSNITPSQFGSLNFSLPMNFAPLQQMDTKSPIFPNEAAPNITITNCENILPKLQFGPKLEASVPGTNESGSRSSSPLSNHERSSPSGTFKPLQKSFSQATSNSFSRRYMHPRRFICNQCRQQFSSLAELNRHTLELHNSFRCNFCKAKFTQRSNLQRHSLKHVGFKPFTCNICQKEYYRKDHLVRHIEVTHPNVDPRVNITTRLTSSECLDFLDNLHVYGNSEGSLEETSTSSQNESMTELKSYPPKLEEGSGLAAESPSEGRAFTPPAAGEHTPDAELPSTASTGQIEVSQPMET